MWQCRIEVRHSKIFYADSHKGQMQFQLLKLVFLNYINITESKNKTNNIEFMLKQMWRGETNEPPTHVHLTHTSNERREAHAGST